MAIVNGYTTAADVQNALGLGTATLTPDTAEIEAAISAVSRQVDDYTGRFFYSTGGTVLFTANDYLFLPIGDWSAVSSVMIDENNTGTPTVALNGTTDFRLTFNRDMPGAPYTAIQITSYAANSLPFGVTEGVKVSGTRGWSAVPEPVKAATLLQSVRIFARRQSPYGVAGSPEGGIVRLLARLDPDVEAMLRPYRVPREAI
jgi:hypothetical protein